MDQLTSIDELPSAVREELGREASDITWKSVHLVHSLMPRALWLRPSPIQEARMNLLGLPAEIKVAQLYAFIRHPQSPHPRYEEDYLKRLDYYAYHLLRAYWGLSIYHYEDILYDAYMRLGEALLRDILPFINTDYLRRRKGNHDDAVTEDLRCCCDPFSLERLKTYIEGE